MIASLHHNLIYILIAIFCFVEDFINGIGNNLRPVLQRPDQKNPPLKKYNLPIAHLITIAIFRFFIGYRSWKEYYRHLKTYHMRDFPGLPSYSNFVDAMNRMSGFGLMMLNAFINLFRSSTGEKELKFADSSQLEVCGIKREFTHKVCKEIARKGKSTTGWFYGFKLHIICNELMQILGIKITPGNIDDRKGLDMIWNDIFGMIIADAGYIGKKWFNKAMENGKHLFTAVKANMRKIMTETQHELLKLRQKVEIVFSVLKLRMGIEISLPRSPLGYFAHYIWCITAYQMKKYFELIFSTSKPLLA